MCQILRRGSSQDQILLQQGELLSKKNKNKQTREKQEARSHISKDNNQLELCLASEEKCQNIEENQCDRTSVYRPSSIYSEGSTEAWWVILISGAQGFAPFFPL